MDLKDVRQSDNVEDARGQRSAGGFGGGGGGLGLLMTIGRLFGIKGIVVALILGGVLWNMGLLNPGMLNGGGSPAGVVSKYDQERADFVSRVLTTTEDVWSEEFRKIGKTYREPKLDLYRGQISTGCGTGSASMGPFYCPEDEKVYIDLSFYDELAETFRSPGDFAQAYVIAHEVGHHVQKLLGTSDFVNSKRGQSDYNQYSVRLELQADYYAGVWANHTKQYLEKGDIEEAMRAANAIGDDAIQMRSQGKVVPHAFTHGTSEQRMRWFNKGLENGTIQGGDTFSMPYRDL
ncbi:neutral zinc metallopeptidase [Luteolibacter pohnpeiensis]|uniref:Neutral zinc metallopeptidase n=1 Tax=Luteolibacter pohnpeiensis TaxID=454153 RepID=A0A934S7X1_9BACT|nr:neutral zinc metallopeptidase [Luteolibacter pohnpeiensis]MBK1882451.1 neutral zinc metallopeptidase [Luteolibacter pohnpeiensis]